MRTMKAVVYKQPGRANGSVTEIPYPACGATQVIIKVMASGICKPAESSHDKNGSVLGKYPVTPGHEFSGIIEEVGSGIIKFKIGDRVTADNGVPCGKCYYCQNDQPAFCSDFGSMGHNLQGSMAQYIAVDEKRVYEIPDCVSFEEASLSELIGCCLRAVERSNVMYGDKVAVMGSGASGMIMAQLFLHSNANEVIVLDSEQSKLNIISKYGAKTYFVDRNHYDTLQKNLSEDYPQGFDIIVDAAGSSEFIQVMLENLKKGGRFVGYSFPWSMKKTVEINMAQFIINEWAYIGSTFNHEFIKCVDILKNKKINCESIISACYPIDKYFEALDKNLNDNKTIKIIIHPNM